MGVIDLLLLPLAILIAVLGLFVDKKYHNFTTITSFICCCVPLIGSIYDINNRMEINDVTGVMDIYPSMIIFFVITSILVVLLNVIGGIKNIKKSC